MDGKHGKKILKIHELNKSFDKVVCISLKEREDKYNFMKKQFKKHKINVEFYRPVIQGYASKFIKPYIDNLQNKELRFNQQFPNELGIMQSFYYVDKTALLEGVQKLFVFEDDFQMHSKWDELLPKYLDTIPNNADAILLYSFMSALNSENIKVSSRWIKGFRSWSHIAIGMTKKYMQEYIKQMDNCPRIADLVTYQMMENGFQVYVAIPPLGIPSKQFISDIRKNNKNYDKPQLLNGNIFMLGLSESLYE